MADYNIGAYSPCSLKLKGFDEEGDGDQEKDKEWFVSNVLKPKGYYEDNKAQFPGICAFTGVCYDDDLLEALWKSLESGKTLENALKSLAQAAGKIMEDEWESEQSEEALIANSDRWYTEDGTEV